MLPKMVENLAPSKEAFFRENMNLKRTLLKVIISLIVVSILVCLALLAAVFWMADPLNIRAPSDQKLISIFQAHRESFEKIQQMATEDAEQGLYLDAPYFSEGSKFTASRQQEYQKLISEIQPGLHVSIDGREKGISFTFAWGGLLAIGSEWGKGIKYEPSDATDQSRYIGVISTNLDNTHALKTGTTYIRPIAPNWFIFYDRTD
jgi:hypothetical protein